MDKGQTGHAKVSTCAEMDHIISLLITPTLSGCPVYHGKLKKAWQNTLVAALKTESEGYFVQAISPLGWHRATARIDIQSLQYMKMSMIAFLLRSIFDALTRETTEGTVFKYGGDVITNNYFSIGLEYISALGVIEIDIMAYGQMVKSLL